MASVGGANNGGHKLARLALPICILWRFGRELHFVGGLLSAHMQRILKGLMVASAQPLRIVCERAHQSKHFFELNLSRSTDVALVGIYNFPALATSASSVGRKLGVDFSASGLACS